ncbi:MAG: hypothetical protein KF873_02190 [Gemmataceae bacterium]|nr:hypothetical protein [Gemmataceae bacterium]
MKSLPSALAFFLLVIAVVGPSATAQPPAQPPAKPQPPAPAATAPASAPRRPVPLDSFQLKLPSTISLGNVRVTTNDLRDGKLIVLDSATKKPTKQHMDSMQAMARELVYALTDKKYYSPPEPTNNFLRPVPSELTLESRFDEAKRFILVPTWGRKLSIDQADYIVWFGVAMDEAIREILDPKPAKAGDPVPAVPAIYRVNAARMMAEAAKSGAPAFYPTILGLLSNPDTDPEVLVYAIKAAEGLIAAFNPILRDDAKYMIHTIKDAEMVKLVTALESIITRTKPYGRKPAAPVPPPPAPPPAPMAPAPKAGDPKGPTIPVGQLQANTVSAEQQLVIRYFRRAAIRALSQVRYPQFVDAQTGKAVYPIVTLAKIAVGDASITTAPGNDEIAAATVGLCNLHDYKDVNVDALCDCIAQGVANFAGKKAGNSQDKSIPWKVVGSHIITALADMQRVPNAGKYRPKFESLATVLTERVLLPLEKINSPGNSPNFEALQRWRETNRPASLKLLDEAKVPAVVPAFAGA